MPDLPDHSDEERTPLGVLREVFGFDRFRGQQLAIIERVIAGGDASNLCAIMCRRFWAAGWVS